MKKLSNYKYFVGIDTGVNTGIAIKERGSNKIALLKTVKIHQAMDIVAMLVKHSKDPVFVLVEDARMATWGRGNDMHRAKGAGSVMRDAKIWEDYLTELGVDFKMCRPKKSLTKLDKKTFCKITGHEGNSSAHARDAAVLILGY